LLARTRVAAQLREEHALVQPMSRRPVDQEEWPEPPTALRAGPRSAPDAASVAGTAIHRALELVPLDGDLVGAMARVRGELPARVRQIVAESAITDPAVEKDASALAQRIHDAFVAGDAFARFQSIAEHIVARELAVLAGVRSADSPLVTASGAIDLVYRDPKTRELVVVDYKSGAQPDASEPDRHRQQVGLYCDALRDALALERRPRGELWYLASSTVIAVG
jgi:ATP-dependent exoDNAse (exonuclease V) beta subunit